MIVGIQRSKQDVPNSPCSDILRDILEQRSNETPDRLFIVQPDGSSWTYRMFREEVCRTANALRSLGVRQSDTVLSWLPNGIDALRVWFGLNYLGAVYVPINTAYRGTILEHVINVSGASLIIGHGTLLPRLGDLKISRLTDAVVLGGESWESSQLRRHEASALSSVESSLPRLDQPIHPWHTQAIIYTSGTTGPSKGVLSSYAHLAATSGPLSFPYFDAHDRFLVNLPMFHVSATAYIYAMLLHGGCVVLADNFRTDEFWSIVDETQATSTLLIGVMAQFLLKQPAARNDKNHSLRTVQITPLDQENALFGERFGVNIFTVYNMTETCVPLVSELNPVVVTSCGRVRQGVSVRLVDQNDIEVPTGTIGEMVVRTDAPWTLSHGYKDDVEATARANRNGWFHTGDAFRMDAHGRYYFVDRIKDAIRRRGENVSSFEVEVEVRGFPAIREAAAIGVPSETGEDEILVAVSLTTGSAIDPAELIGFLTKRLPYFMVPRYVRVMPDLPKTPTKKVQKVSLRSEGITKDTWDRQNDPTIVIKREKF